MPIDPLDVENLPSDPREMALRLLGMTVSELKGIDEKVISGQRYVGGINTDINKIIQDVTTNLSPNQNTIPQHAITTESIPTSNNIDMVEAIPVITTVQSVEVQEEKDKDQLEFDFYRKIKPEDLEYQLKKINSVLEDLVFKIDAVYNILLKKSTKNLNGNYR